MENEMHSFNHPMFGSYDGWLYNCIAGINVSPDAVSADKLIIRPRLAKRLNKVSASVKTLRGVVSCSYKTTEAGTVYNITIPTNTTAEIILEGKILKVNGKKFTGKKLEVLSGNYRIETK